MRLDATFVSRAERGSRHRGERGAAGGRNGRARGRPGPPPPPPPPPRFPALSRFCAFSRRSFRGPLRRARRAAPRRPPFHESFERRVSPARPPRLSFSFAPPSSPRFPAAFPSPPATSPRAARGGGGTGRSAPMPNLLFNDLRPSRRSARSRSAKRKFSPWR